MDINNITISGKISDQMKTKTFPSGKNALEFSIQVDKGFGKSFYVGVSVFNEKLIQACQPLQVGTHIVIEGSIEVQAWTDAQSGMKRTKSVINAIKLTPLNQVGLSQPYQGNGNYQQNVQYNAGNNIGYGNQGYGGYDQRPEINTPNTGYGNQGGYGQNQQQSYAYGGNNGTNGEYFNHGYGQHQHTYQPQYQGQPAQSSSTASTSYNPYQNTNATNAQQTPDKVEKNDPLCENVKSPTDGMPF